MDEKLNFTMEKDPLYRMGLASGLLKAKAKRDREFAIEIAERMKEADMPIAQIAKYTKLSIEEIEKL